MADAEASGGAAAAGAPARRWAIAAGRKAPLHGARHPMNAAKAGPDAGLCGGRLELLGDRAKELVALALLDRRCQGEQQVHFFSGEAERHGAVGSGWTSPTMAPRGLRLQEAGEEL